MQRMARRRGPLVVLSAVFRYNPPMVHGAPVVDPKAIMPGSRRQAAIGLLTGAAIAMTIFAGCEFFPARIEDNSAAYYLPLDVNLRLDRTVTAADFEYRDACQQPQRLAIGDRFKKALTREVGLVFNKVRVVEGDAVGPMPDGQVTVDLGLHTVETFIPTKRRGKHAAIVTMGATTAFFDAAGAEIFAKNLRVETKGEIETNGESCDVTGLPTAIDQAVATLVHGIKKNLGMAVPIQRLAAEPPSERRRGGMGGVPPKPSQALPGSESAPKLAVRTIVQDATSDHVLQGGEEVIVRVEVSNSGNSRAKSVGVDLFGPPIWAQAPATSVALGDLEPGETKRAEFSGRVRGVKSPEQADLVVAVKAATLGAPLMEEKTIPVSLRPATGFVNEPIVDVDHIPARPAGLLRRKAVGLAIGLSTHRDPTVKGLPYAGQDAVTLARYWGAIGGISDSHLRVLTNDRATKDAWADALEDWLPARSEPGGTVFIYISGRVLAASSGASFLAYEAQRAGSAGLFSLRRLTAALAKLPAQQIVLFLDVEPTEAAEEGGEGGGMPDWLAGVSRTIPDKVILIVSAGRGQSVHALEAGRHGLFAYWLLRGLAGEADLNRDGSVWLGEAYDWLTAKVPEVAQRLDGREQTPISDPPLTSGAKGRDVLLTKVR